MEKQKPSELSKGKLSIALATFNEERSLRECLFSVKNLTEEIVVVDGTSSDKTIEIAKSFGAKVIITDNQPIFHINKQHAIDECKGEWVLLLDADEVVTPELAEEITKVINNPEEKYVAYFVKRKKMFMGRWIKKGGQFPDPVIRLFKKGKAFLPCKSVHEQMQVQGETGWLKALLLHYPTPSITAYITKDNRYSTLSALELMEKKAPIRWSTYIKYIFWEPFSIFFSLYIRHRGFADGFPGFVFAYYSGLHRLTSFIKYWEMKKTGKEEVSKDWV